MSFHSRRARGRHHLCAQQSLTTLVDARIISRIQVFSRGDFSILAPSTACPRLPPRAFIVTMKNSINKAETKNGPMGGRAAVPNPMCEKNGTLIP